MKLSAKEDISAPLDLVFAQVCEPDRLERTVRQRGGAIRRTPAGPLEKGTRWDARLAFRGASQSVTFVLTTLDAPNIMRFRGTGASFDISVDVELVALGPATTRLTVTTQGTPKTLPARIMAQSLKLAHGQMLTRYQQRISEYAAEIAKEGRLS